MCWHRAKRLSGQGLGGIPPVAYSVSDRSEAMGFWHDFLGFDELYDLKKSACQDLRVAFIKIDDHQHGELFNEPAPAPPSSMNHLCFTADDIQQMRA